MVVVVVVVGTGVGERIREQIPRFFSILGNPLVKLYYLYFTDFDTSPRRSRVPST